ncbi:hypothetical protein Fcan01_27153 [Folsomia candida]|uniref:DUF4806 domain-containing protein n=1 Tax=Folsomia candida TaxID=158441 RepID=A0A226D1I8_FOLCA|nr:hypothetical protein Fcan01_27153 [Folsomia candida]
MSETNLKQFCVVDFPADKTIDVVPKTWLSADNTKCQFPSNRPKGFKKTQEDPGSLPDPLWKIWDIVVKKSYESFDRANNKAKKLLKSNYVDSSDFEIVPESSQSQEELNVEDGTSNNVDQIIESIPITLNYDEHLAALIGEFRIFQETSIQNQLILQEEIKDLKAIVLRCLNSLSNVQPLTSIIWPIKNNEDLEKVNQCLADPNTYNREVIFLGRIGGGTVSRAVNETMSGVIKHEFALILRLTDASKKISFGGTPCCKLVKDAIRHFFLHNAPGKFDTDLCESKLDSMIAKWLRDSINRGEEGKQKRSKAKDGRTKVDKTLQGEEGAESNVASD